MSELRSVETSLEGGDIPNWNRVFDRSAHANMKRCESNLNLDE